jgi:L-ribulose-5-phosphate 3-epimerase UlaE
LYEVTEYAASNAAMLAIENVDTDFMNTIPKIMRYIDKVNSPWLCLYPDIGNLNAAGCTPEEIEDDITQNVSRIAAFHVKDVQPKIIRNIGYGTGIVDFEAFFRLLGRLNFRGPLVAEMWTDETEESVKKVITAKDFINSKMALSQERVALKR